MTIRVDFCNYAEFCFWEFGDRVKNWITLNEPWSFCFGGYVIGTFAPGRGATSPEHVKGTIPLGRCTPWQQEKFSNGDPATEPYLVAHYQLLTHAAVVDLYRKKFQVSATKHLDLNTYLILLCQKGFSTFFFLLIN